jgi:hypothetical protein
MRIARSESPISSPSPVGTLDLSLLDGANMLCWGAGLVAIQLGSGMAIAPSRDLSSEVIELGYLPSR